MNLNIARVLLLGVGTWAGNTTAAISQSGTSADITSRDPTRTYLSLKKSFGRIPVEYLRVRGEPVRLSSCISASELYGTDLGERLPLTRALAELAFNILWIDGSLRVGKYPPELWASELSSIEQDALRKLPKLGGQQSFRILDIDAGLAALAEKLGKYHSSHPATIPVMAKAEGCGDMMGPVLDIKTTPPAKQIQYMTQHFADLCADQGFEFSDDRCKTYWRNYEDGLTLRGKYVFAVQWASGPPAYRKWEFEKMKSQNGKIRLEVSQ